MPRRNGNEPLEYPGADLTHPAYAGTVSTALTTDIATMTSQTTCRGEQDVDASTPRFSVATDPWIHVRLLDGRSLDVSVRDALRRAPEIREIVGELPTQSFAITRLLLAILYRTRLGEAFSFEEWRRWHDDGLPLAVVDEYLESYAERFELFGPRPFFQVADLETMSGKRSEVTPLILDLPSNNRLFTNRSGVGAVDLSFAEATRWLVNAQAFDASGIKSGAVGDPRVKGGKGYPLGLAWSGLLGGILAQGANLHETLLLNLIGPGFGVEMDGMRDLPPWEDEQPDTAQEREDPGPYGPVRLYTWQSRRIRLFTDGERVTACIVANGDKLTPQNQRIHEPMTAWRYSEPQSKAAKQTTYMPREHLAGRALWRGISALLPRVATPIAKVGVPGALPPGLVDWLGALDEEGLIPGRHRVRLRSVGVVYGSNNSVVDDVLTDDLLLPLALLHAHNHSVAVQAEEAV